MVVGGASAGGQSVDLHITAYGGRDDDLFHATAAESQSFSALRTVSESQFAYDNLVIRTNCASARSTLACLRNLSATELQEHNINTPFPGAQNPPLYMYGPTLDFDFISDYTYRAYADGKLVRVPSIGGDDTNEGTVFTNISTCCMGDSDAFIKDQFPSISLAQLRRWNQLYPPGDTPQVPNTGRYWAAVSKGYGELRYICPSSFVNGVQANLSVPNWNYRWNVVDPEMAREGKCQPLLRRVIDLLIPSRIRRHSYGRSQRHLGSGEYQRSGSELLHAGRCQFCHCTSGSSILDELHT